jgi:hypothetical protein
MTVDDANEGSPTSAVRVEYQLTIKGEGLTLERTITEPQAFQVLAVLMGNATNVSATASQVMPSTAHLPGYSHTAADPPPDGHLPVTTIGEYLVQKAAKRNPDKITAIAAYLKEYRGLDRFSREDIKAEFPHAGEVVPKNFPRDFNWAVSTKWIASDSAAGKDQYYITGTGLAAVQASFSREVAKSQTAVRRRTSRRKAATEE